MAGEFGGTVYKKLLLILTYNNQQLASNKQISRTPSHQDHAIAMDKSQHDDEGGEEDGGRTLTICADWAEEMQAKAGPSSPGGLLHGLDLDLSLAERKSDGPRGRGVQEECVLVVFDLPDGSQGESMFKLGQTVEVLKSFVESEYGIPMPLQTMFLDDKLLMDPLSLLDYPEAKGLDEIIIRVEGPLTNEFKK